MTQDTRKDRRVKIVSLNVRYKSATVDEFIENHAHDVSRGGIFIKTTTPFPGGTLLKFEIRLVSDQAVIAGVGRVVWKREASTATAEHPAGMGVKFIKVDEPSKAVIDRLINTRSDAGKSYDDESEGTDRTPRPGSEPPVAALTPDPAQRTTMLGTNPPLQPSENRAEPLVAARAAPPRPQKQGMFPQDDFEKETYPKQEQTVMKQAAELLEEALREAGGSMEEVGNNPLFSATGSASRIPAHAVASATENKPAVATANPTDSARLRSERASGAGTEQAAIHAKTLLGGLSHAPAKRSSEPPRAPSESRRKASGKDDRPPASGRPRPLAARTSTPAIATRKAPSKMAILLGAAAVVALGLFLLRDTLFGESADKPTAEPAQTTPSAVTAVNPPPPSAPAASATPAPETSASAVATALAASESASAAPVASAARSASSRVVAVDTPRAATTAAPPPAAPVPARVAPSPAPAATTTVAATPMPATSVESPAGGAPSATAAPAPPSATAASAASPRPAPPPALPRAAPPAKPADDNPY